MKKVIKFLKYRYITFGIALVLIIAGLIVAFTKGPNWGIDFQDGLSMTVAVKDFNAETGTFEVAVDEGEEGALLIGDVRSWFSGLENEPKIQLQSTESARYTIRTVFRDKKAEVATVVEAEVVEGNEVVEAEVVETKMAEVPAEKNQLEVETAKLTGAMAAVKGLTVISDSDFVGGLNLPSSGRLVVIESSQSSSPSWTANNWNELIILMLVVFLLIGIYIAFRFSWSFAVAAIVALSHDILILIGFVCIMPFEVTKTTVAAFLTIVGYSLNDTIVVFDRIRENRRLMLDSPIETIINTSITQSLSRTILTSLTTFLAVAALFIFTQGDVKSFSANMMAGVVVGTFSSIFVASPILLELMRLQERILKRRRAKKFGGSVSATAISTSATVSENGVVEIPMLERKLRRKRK